MLESSNTIGVDMEQAQKVFNRLSSIEKIDIRSANIGRLEYLADTSHRSDMPLLTLDERAAVLVEVKALCQLEFAIRAQYGMPGYKG